MKNIISIYSSLVDILSIVDDFPTDCPDKLLNDGFDAIRTSCFGTLRRATEYINECVSQFKKL